MSLLRLRARLSIWLFTLWCLPLATTAAPKLTPFTPITPEEIALTDSTIEPGAGAEVLLYEVNIEAETRDRSTSFYTSYITPAGNYWHYMRVKIFSTNGAQQFLKHRFQSTESDLSFFESKTDEISARTLKPDGSIQELDPKDMFKRDTTRRSSFYEREETTIAIPGVEPGCVIELRWRTINGRDGSIYMPFQLPFPAKLIRYRYYPDSDLGFQSKAIKYRGTPPAKQPDGSFLLESTNNPALRDEPHSLPTILRSSAYILWYTPYSSDGAAVFRWINFANYINRQVEEFAGSPKSIAKLTQPICASGTNDLEKLRLIYDHIQTKIRNADYSQAPKLASDSLKQSKIYYSRRNQLLVAMARSIGLEAYLAYAASTRSLPIDFKKPQSLLPEIELAAVRIKGEWLFFDPGYDDLSEALAADKKSVFRRDPPLRFGRIPSDAYNTDALICYPEDELIIVKTPKAQPDQAIIKRTGKFTLSADGKLSGEITLELAGTAQVPPPSYFQKRTLDTMLADKITAGHPTWQLAELVCTPAQTVYDRQLGTARLTLPLHANATDRRLLFSPAIFQAERPLRFTATERKNDIFLSDNRTTLDEIQIQLPAGYALEFLPKSESFPENPLGSYNVKISYDPQTHSVTYTRKLIELAGSYVPTAYPKIKAYFDLIQKTDDQNIVLIASEATTAAPPNPAPAALN